MDPIISELWGEIRRYLNTADRADAADTVVSVLIDNNYAAEDIRDAFRNDADIKHALSQYIDTDKIHEDEDEDDDYLDGMDDPDY